MHQKILANGQVYRIKLLSPKSTSGVLGSRSVDRGVAERAFDGFAGMMVQRNDFVDGR